MRVLILFLACLVAGCYCRVFAHSKPQECSDPNEEYVLTDKGDDHCFGYGARRHPEHGCRCKRGFVRHEGRCIQWRECPQRCHKKNEIFILSSYKDHTCTADGAKLKVPVWACRCRKGHVRTSDGECIKFEECPPQCTLPNEVYIETKYEDNTCDGIGKEVHCLQYACRCKNKFVRHEGRCINADRCPLKCTKANEEYVFDEYEDETCEGPGAKMDEAGMVCRCKKGFLRNYRGFCVKPENCIFKCPVNEVFVYTEHEDDTCYKNGAELNEPTKACRCKEGLVRDETGICINKCDCPPRCPNKNEDFIMTSYLDDTCDESGAEMLVPIEACRCIPGHVRHDKGICIDFNDCPPKCVKDNEVYVYADFEDSTCDDDGEEMDLPEDACRCIPGYVRDASGNCIHSSKCPPKCLLDNEVYVWADYGDYSCYDDAQPLDDTVRACRCIDGYVRSSSGECIKRSDCPPMCLLDNEVYIWTDREDRRCYHEGHLLEKTIRACRCEDGYVRDSSGKCIKECDCPPLCEKPNEVYIWTNIEDRTCDGKGNKMDSTVRACRCADGYVRDADGNCIIEQNCPVLCEKPNEIFVWTNTEDKTCDGKGKKLDCTVRACRCEKGYVRDAQGNCIDKHDCPPLCKKQNEISVVTDYEDSTCDKTGEKTGNVEKVCRCQPNYVRSADGDCILVEECPPKCQKANEIYVFTNYEDSTCEGIGVQMEEFKDTCRCDVNYVRNDAGDCILSSDCPPKCYLDNEIYAKTRYTDKTCVGKRTELDKIVKQCRCDKGYVRNKGICILASDCPTCGLNEEYVLATAKDGTCVGPGEEIQPIEACRCIEGFVRFEGECIDSNECPTCDINESLVIAYTEDSTCTGSGSALKAPKEVCRCKKGFVRHDGKCIDQQQCPTCGKNEIFILTRSEDRTCTCEAKLLDKPTVGCRCRPGFVRHDGRCVLPCNCPTCSDPNEVFISTETQDNTCTSNGKQLDAVVETCRCKSGYVRFNGVCIPSDSCPVCSLPNESLVLATRNDNMCTKIGDLMEEPSEVCRCNEGYVRNNGTCIEPEDCPACSGANEELVWTHATDSTCTKPGKALSSPVEDCRCKNGYVRDTTSNKCILMSECRTCGRYEVLKTSKVEDSTCAGPGDILKEAVEACRCQSGFVRYKDECIIYEFCPKCGPNEIYDISFQDDSTCLYNVYLEEPEEKCFCIDGYVRHNGVCILDDDCPTCSRNETFTLSQYEDSTCTSVGIATLIETEKCLCLPGYVRYNGNCIKKNDCPSCGENEDFVTTESEDDTCTSLGNALNAAIEACRCKPGLVRHENKCIPSCECPTCGEYEEYVKTSKKDPTCSGPAEELDETVEACRCQEGFVRHSEKCILPLYCPEGCED